MSDIKSVSLDSSNLGVKNKDDLDEMLNVIGATNSSNDVVSETTFDDDILDPEIPTIQTDNEPDSL